MTENIKGKDDFSSKIGTTTIIAHLFWGLALCQEVSSLLNTSQDASGLPWKTGLTAIQNKTIIHEGIIPS